MSSKGIENVVWQFFAKIRFGVDYFRRVNLGKSYRRQMKAVIMIPKINILTMFYRPS